MPAFVKPTLRNILGLTSTRWDKLGAVRVMHWKTALILHQCSGVFLLCMLAVPCKIPKNNQATSHLWQGWRLAPKVLAWLGICSPPALGNSVSSRIDCWNRHSHFSTPIRIFRTSYS